ncbi:MAG TPA: redoxin family protein [Sphingomonas sp.]|jgi:cytochrome c biogenesis protein CcmG/thiol:disulfide interchange protein DsbE|uniref:redoxin family protein n=1 Tax=Sphingomonas sp. TaxID=28214 RepID=UPI002EDB3D6E
MTKTGIRWLLWVPLIAFLLFLALVASGLLHPADRTIASRLVGQPMPAVRLPAASSTRPGLATGAGTGQPRLVNIFASWCVPCAAEAPQLEALAKAGVPIDAIAIRDRREDVDQFLARYGNPYRAVGSDVDSRVQLALGSSGVPETFVVDGKGIIRAQKIGDIRMEDVAGLIAMVRSLR